LGEISLFDQDFIFFVEDFDFYQNLNF